MLRLTAFLIFITLLTAFSCLTSCEVINPPEKIPSYLNINSISLSTTPSTEGSNSEKITDAWVYVNSEFIGAFELPASVPVLTEGNAEITIHPGIKENGISATRVPYTFYDPYTSTINLTSGSVTTISPVVTYKDNLNFWIEDFEDPNVKFTASSLSDVPLDRTTDPSLIFEGSYSGEVIMASGETFFEGVTDENFVLPTGGKPVYLEMDFMTNNSVLTGIYTYPGGFFHPAVTLNPTTNDQGDLIWNKIYINLTEVVSTNYQASEIELIIASDKDDGITTTKVYLDNIKLVYGN